MDGHRRYSAARHKACYVTIAFWVVLVIVGSLAFADVSGDLPTDWFKQLMLHQSDFAFLRRTTRDVSSPEESPVEFKLPFKTLYVFSKVQKSVDSNVMNLPQHSLRNTSGCTTPATEDSQQNVSHCGKSAIAEYQPLQNTSKYIGVKKELCASTGLDNDDLFYCSQLFPSGDNIFFLETSCAANQEAANPNGTSLPLSEKQSCSIYSAAHHNPSRKVILLFTCPVPVGYNWTKEWAVLFDLPNFFFGRVMLADLYANTSLSTFYHGQLAKSKYQVSHQSDLFRQFVMYIYGGTYMDLDVITFKSLDDLGTNYVIHQGDDLITAGVLNLEPEHNFMRKCLFNAISIYDPKNFPTIGPNLYTSTFRSLCGFLGKLDPKSLLDLRSCNLRVLPVTTFFSVHYLQWENFYKCNLWPEVDNMTRDSYGVHYWNHLGNLVLYVGSKQPIVKFAEKHCPPVYYNAGLTLS